MGDKKIVVLFPGVRYGTDCPLLYYAGFKYETRGYEIIEVSYGNLHKQDNSPEENMEYIKSSVLTQLKAIDFSKYGDIVFVSKSLGTVIAGWVEEQLCIGARQIYLTPVKETLPYIRNGKNIKIVIAGTDDKYLDADILRKHCIKENIHLKQIEGAGHRLEVKGDVDKNIDILKEIVDLY